MKTKDQIFKEAAGMLSELGFKIAKYDDQRPWGGFYVIEESQAQHFAAHFFPNEDFKSLQITEKLSPKILIVAPNTRLSWQYHHRRAEIWKCLQGPIGVATSDTDEEKEMHVLGAEDIIKLTQGERHRLIGREDWGLVAEIWQHTDAAHPSDEDDIVRVQDDFGR
jgi:mannose-6-phosphate isomerase-like protein (cupin superfamily)